MSGLEGMVVIPGGTVRLGTSEAALDIIAEAQHFPRTWFEDESPCLEIALASFLIDRHPVTNGQFAQFVAETGYQTLAEREGYGLVYTDTFWQETRGAYWRAPGGPGTSVENRMDHPVVQIAYTDALEYAQWRGVRLPTEAEWEYAARAGTNNWWPWGDEWDGQRCANAEFWAGFEITNGTMWRTWWTQFVAEHGNQPGTMPVGGFSGLGDSPFGIGDMAGNVCEWTASPYWLYGDPDRYDEMFRFVVGRYQVVRGGSWMMFRFQVRCAERIAVDPAGYRTFALGFRCAADL